MVDPDTILAKFGLAPEPEPVPVAPLHTAAAERHRGALLANLAEAVATIEALKVTVVHYPFNETAIMAHVEATRRALAGADASLRGMGEVMCCKGEA